MKRKPKRLLITEFGNPVLHKKARRVAKKDLTTMHFKKLATDMLYTMRRTQGVGIAAPQVGVSKRLAILEMRPTPTRPNMKRKGPLVIINPRILAYGKARVNGWEGCLSLPGIRGKVPRAKTLLVEYMNDDGEVVRERVSGFWARIFQHETDHLHGIGYFERMKDLRTLITLSEYKKRILKKK